MVLLLPLVQQAVGDGLQEVADSQGDFFIVHRHPHANAVNAQVMENGSGLAPGEREQDSVSKGFSSLCPLDSAGTKKRFSSVNLESVQARVLIFSHCSQTTQIISTSPSSRAENQQRSKHSVLTRALCPVHIPENVLTAARISSGFLVSISCSSKLTPLFWKILSAPASSRPRTMRLFAAWVRGRRTRGQ